MKLIQFIEKNLNAIFINIVSGVAIVAISGIFAWLCLTVSEHEKSIAVLEAVR